MNLYRPKKQLKNSKEVLEFFNKKKVKQGFIPYKGGFGVFENGRIKEIYMSIKELKKKYAVHNTSTISGS